MPATGTIDVGGAVRTTRLPGVTRIDVQNLGAAVPEPLRDPERDPEARKAWIARHNQALLDALESAAAGAGGDFNAFAEWTTMCGGAYDFKDINTRRRERFDGAYRAAITTVFGMDIGTGLAARVQATAFVPDPGVAFQRFAWQPRALYDTEFMALAPAVTVRFAGAKQLFLSGVMDWDRQHQQQHTDDARAQIRNVLERIIASFEEAGGSRQDVLRLRPILPTPDCVALLEQEVAELWADIPPVITLWAGLPMPKGQFAEIQAYGMLGEESATVTQNSATTGAVPVRVARGKPFAMFVAGPFGRADQTPAETAGQVRTCLADHDLSQEDVCTAYVAARDRAAADQFAAADVVPADSLHVIAARPEADLAGAPLRVEITAGKLTA